jgi:hypothetical protein
MSISANKLSGVGPSTREQILAERDYYPYAPYVPACLLPYALVSITLLLKEVAIPGILR